MKNLSMFSQILVLGLVAAAGAQAAALLTTTTALPANSPIQVARLSRNNIAQDWSGGEPFPGLLNPTTPYAYQTFSVPVGLHRYVQIEIKDPGGDLYVSAYQGAYLPDSSTTGNLGFDKNWLGDAGQSGNYAFFVAGGGVDPRYFQVVAKPFSTLIVVVNETTTGAGIGHPFTLTVEGFEDTEYGN